MQMNNIAPAIAAALTLSALTLSGPATAAGENVIVYGQANVSYDMISTGTTTGLGSSSGISSSRVSSNSSRIGLKGSNQLGKGWSAVWQAEASVATDTGAAGVAPASVSTSTTTQVPPVFPATTTTYATVTTTTTGTPQIFDRDTYLGIYNEDYGTLLAGRHDTPYKMSTRRLDVFADGIADNRSLMGTTMFGGAGGVVIQTFDVRMSDMIAYISPNFRSFSIALGYSNLAEGNMNMNQANASALSLAVMYEKDPVYATFAYEVYTTTPPKDPATAVKAAKLGLGYKLGIFDLGFAYEKGSDEYGNANPYDAATNPCGGMAVGANCSGHSTTYTSLKLNFTDADRLKLAYSKAGQVGAASTATGAIQFSMGFDHDFNEHTTAYALFSVLKNDRLVSYGLSSAASSGGVNSVNSTGDGGAAPSVFSFGLRHSFW